MDPELETTPTAPAVDMNPAYDFRELDRESLEIMIADKIATGG